MLSDIIDQVSRLWSSSGSEKEIIFVDDGFSELLKWRNRSSEVNVDLVPVLSINMDLIDLALIRSYMAKRALFCLSNTTTEILRKVKQLISLSGVTDAIILTTVSPEALKATVDSSQFLIFSLILYFPMLCNDNGLNSLHTGDAKLYNSQLLCRSEIDFLE